MRTLKLLLLGSPRLERNGVLLQIHRRKAIALFVYLAVTNRPHHRDALATLFWPEAVQSRARASLRRALSDLNRAIGTPWSETPGEQVTVASGLDVWTDVSTFRDLLQAYQSHNHPADMLCTVCVKRLADAVALYRDDFLAGFTLPDAPAFDEWQLFQAEGLRSEFGHALERLSGHHVAQGEPAAALPYARCWAMLAPLNPSAHATLMQVYARTGQRTRALRQYREYVDILDKELGVGPDAEMMALCEDIRRGQVSPISRPPLFIPSLSSLRAPGDREDEIRPVTVLCAGLSGAAEPYTQVGSLAQAVAALEQILHGVASQYGGRVESQLGDRIQVLFGIPHIHEDDPLRAVQAAIEIRDQAQERDLDVAVGLGTGQAYWRCSSLDTHLGGDAVLGPVVRLAAQLQDCVCRGQVLASQATWRHARRAFDFSKVIVRPGGQAEFITAYRVNGPLLHPEKARGIDGFSASMVGRDRELGALHSALERVIDGQGRMVSVIGEAGLGKSRLVAEFHQSAAANDRIATRLLWMEGRCFEWRSATGYWPFVDILQCYLRALDGDETSLAHSLTAILDATVQHGYLPRGRLAGMGALLGRLLSLRFEDGRDRHLDHADPEQVRYRTILALRDLIQALACQHLLVLVFEDLQWIDDLSLDVISLLLEALASVPFLLLCVYRPQGQMGQRLSNLVSHTCPDRYAEVRLRALTPDEGRHLITSLLSTHQLPAKVEEMVLDRAQGNPFFLEEALRTLLERGILYKSGGRWQVRDGAASVTVPDSVQSVVLGRIDRLQSDLKDVLCQAAILGRVFSVPLLAEMTPEGIDLNQTLLALEDAALIYRERTLPEVEYAFIHGIAQEAIYQTLSHEHRARLHRQAAEAIEVRYQQNLEPHYEQLAYHYSQVENETKAIEFLLKAGNKAARAYLNKQAASNYRQALARCENMVDSPTRSQWMLEALAGLGEICHRLGQDAEAELCLDRAIATGKKTGAPTPVLLRLHHWLAETMIWQGRPEESIGVAREGLGLLDKGDAESVGAVLMNQAVAVARLAQGDLEQFCAMTDRTARFVRRLPYSEALRPAYLHIILNKYFGKRTAEAEQWINVLKELAEQHYDLRALAEVHDYRAEYCLQSGDLDGAASHAAQSATLYQDIGAQGRTWRSLETLTWACLVRGNLDRAAEWADKLLALAEDLQQDVALLETYLAAGLVFLCLRAWKRAEEAFVSALCTTTPKASFAWFKWTAPYCLGRLYLARGQIDRATALFEQALDGLDWHIPVGWYRLKWWSPLACILSGLETACESRVAFQALCRRKKEALINRHPEWEALPLRCDQWYLEPGSMVDRASVAPSMPFADPSTGKLDPGWQWHDPSGDCSFRLAEGCEIYAAHGRDLWHVNKSAPRLLRQVSGNWAIQTTCTSIGERPAVGGLLFWKDQENYLCLTWGKHGQREVCFDGCIADRDLLIGRGLLPAEGFLTEQVHLCMERDGSRVTALCSADGLHWFGAGSVDFAVSDPVNIGVYAVGWINRAIYLDAQRCGAAIRFASFELWTG